jgi:hypothetical protein
VTETFAGTADDEVGAVDDPEDRAVVSAVAAGAAV